MILILTSIRVRVRVRAHPLENLYGISFQASSLVLGLRLLGVSMLRGKGAKLIRYKFLGVRLRQGWGGRDPPAYAKSKKNVYILL